MTSIRHLTARSAKALDEELERQERIDTQRIISVSVVQETWARQLWHAWVVVEV